MNQGSASRPRAAGQTLTGSAGGALPNTRTQGSHQRDLQLHTLPLPALLRQVINLKKECFSHHFVIFSQRLSRQDHDFYSVSFWGKLPVVYNQLCGILNPPRLSAFPLYSTPTTFSVTSSPLSLSTIRLCSENSCWLD